MLLTNNRIWKVSIEIKARSMVNRRHALSVILEGTRPCRKFKGEWLPGEYSECRKHNITIFTPHHRLSDMELFEQDVTLIWCFATAVSPFVCAWEDESMLPHHLVPFRRTATKNILTLSFEASNIKNILTLYWFKAHQNAIPKFLTIYITTEISMRLWK